MCTFACGCQLVLVYVTKIDIRSKLTFSVCTSELIQKQLIKLFLIDVVRFEMDKNGL